MMVGGSSVGAAPVGGWQPFISTDGPIQLAGTVIAEASATGELTSGILLRGAAVGRVSAAAALSGQTASVDLGYLVSYTAGGYLVKRPASNWIVKS